MKISVLLMGAALALLGDAARADILYVGNITSPPDIVKFTSGGSGSVFVNVTNGLFTPYSFAFDPSGNLFVAGSSTIQKIAPNGVITPFVTTAGSSTALAFDSAGNLYVALNTLNRIDRYTPGGDGSVFASGLNNPTNLAFDSAGNLYTNDGTITIRRITPGGAGSVFVTGSGVNTPTDLAFDGAGNLYVANDADNTITKFTPGGSGSLFTSSGVTHPSGLAFDSAGHLFVANSGNNTIREFSSTGVDLGTFASSGLHFPKALAFTDDAGVPLPLANQVPEPSAVALLGLGMLGFAARRRRPAV